MIDHANINALWGSLLVEELVRGGVTDFVIAPGSRSAPLVLAVARNERARGVVAVDERGAAYLALGIARGGRTAAVITTSGTAVANLFPALVEASADHVPLLLLTADRPPELREAGANQTIRQVNIFGGHVRWAHDLPCPDERIPARMLLTTAGEALARARGPDPGPVHLNIPFREPLAPSPEPFDRSCLSGTDLWQSGEGPFTAHAPVALAPPPVDVALHRLAEAGSGIVVAGSLSGDRQALEAVSDLASRLQWPLVADVRSQLRLGLRSEWHVPHLPRILEANAVAWRPGAILQLGGRITSRRLQRLLEGETAREHIVIDPAAERLDPGHRVRMRIQADAAAWCDAAMRHMAASMSAAPGGVHAPGDRRFTLDELRRLSARIEDAIERTIDETKILSEPFVARWLTRHVPTDHGLYVSSSLPIRDVDSYGAFDGPPVPVASNRGASGIDGILASAAGYAIGRRGPVTLLIGDLAFLHDLSSLFLLQRVPHPVVVVLVNNRGGGIFSFLPIAAHREVFSPWFDTPHEVDIAGATSAFGIPHARASARGQFADAYQAALSRPGASVIEVISDRRANLDEHERIERAIAVALGNAHA